MNSTGAAVGYFFPCDWTRCSTQLRCWQVRALSVNNVHGRNNLVRLATGFQCMARGLKI